MTFEGDPYRELGVAPGASLNEIKSAYRRLVKRYHPDAAGERALPRFLSIQAAYERLVDGEGRLRSSGGGAPRPGAGGGGGSGGSAWRADPGRARASRDAWRARRSGSGGTAGYRASGSASGRAAPGPGAAPGTGTGSSSSRPPGSGAGPASGPGPGSGPSSSRPPGAGERHHRRNPRTATPGSTTYDEAAETPLDPEWDGGAWYGPSSGTYWTINPREYADPRKHGPEYLARAKRAASGRREPGSGAEDGSFTGEPDGDPGDFSPEPEAADWAWTGTRGGDSTTGGAGAWRARAWSYETADEPATAWTPGRERPAPRDPREPGDHRAGRHGRRPYDPAAPGPAASPDAGAFPDLESLVRRALPENLLALARRPDRRWCLLLAFIAWPPIGYGLGGLISAVTGCAVYAASCPDAVPIALIAVQPLILAGLFLAPPVAAVAASAALAALAVALPAGAILSVGALPRPVIEPTVLGVIVATTYGIAFAAGVVRLWRLPREAGSGSHRAP